MAADETRCCATCGFMGLGRPGSGSVPLDEAGEHYRDSGVCDLGKYDGAPHCHKGAADLPAETNAAAQRITDGRRGNGHRPDAVLEVLQTPRSGCPWTKWRPQYSPKEHDMILADQLALETQQAVARALSLIASLQGDHLALKQQHDQWTKQQAEENARFAKQIQALEETRHQETRQDGAALKRTEINAIWGTTILIALLSIANLVVTLLK